MRRIADITIAKTDDIDRADEHISIANITAQVGVSFGSVKRNISIKFVPCGYRNA